MATVERTYPIFCNHEDLFETKKSFRDNGTLNIETVLLEDRPKCKHLTEDERCRWRGFGCWLDKQKGR